MNFKYKNNGFFLIFLAISGCDAYFNSELRRNYFKPMLSRVSWAAAQISCVSDSPCTR